MERLKYKYLKEDVIARVRNIIMDDPRLALDVLRDCAEIAGIVSKEDFHKLSGLSKRTVQYQCRKGKIECQEISGVKYPAINVYLEYNL